MRALTNPVAALLEPGYRVDRYELLAKIGQGGMASVWLARAEGAEGDRFFAVKTIAAEHAGDDQLRKMMLDEARIAMAIDHPNVARTLEVGQLWDMPYLVLEYVAGESLDQLCQSLTNRGASMPPAIAVRLLFDTCQGLHAAHELAGPDGKCLEIVHRDLSPHNILVDQAGTVKLIDFGIAKAAERLSQTASGTTKGKIPYMAPEQALGGFVDRRADLWSLGAVLYVLLAGTYPFDGANDAARLMGKLSGDPPTPLPDAVPEKLRAVVDRALSFYREARYANAAELAEALDAAVPKASEAEVARFFADNLLPAMKARKHIVDHALAAANARARARELLSGTTSTPPRRSAVPEAALAEPVTGVDEGPSVATIGGPKKRGAARPPWLAYVSVAAIALIILVAFVLGTATGRGTAGPPPLADNAGPSGATTGPPPTPAESATVPSLTIAPAAPSASVTMRAPPPGPSARASTVANPVPPPLPPVPPSAAPSASAKKKPPPEDTIF